MFFMIPAGKKKRKKKMEKKRSQHNDIDEVVFLLLFIKAFTCFVCWYRFVVFVFMFMPYCLLQSLNRYLIIACLLPAWKNKGGEKNGHNTMTSIFFLLFSFCVFCLLFVYFFIFIFVPYCFAVCTENKHKKITVCIFILLGVFVAYRITIFIIHNI